MVLWWQIVVTILCVILSGTFSGLTLGLMSLDIIDLRILSESGTDREKSHARRILPVRKRANFLLCTLLIGNTAVNSALSIVTAGIFGGIAGFLSSTIVILYIGEIIPQAICHRFGLVVGAYAIPLVRFFMFLTAIISYPTSLVLDKLLGGEPATRYNKSQLLSLLSIHGENREDSCATRPPGPDQVPPGSLPSAPGPTPPDIPDTPGDLGDDAASSVGSKHHYHHHNRSEVVPSNGPASWSSDSRTTEWHEAAGRSPGNSAAESDVSGAVMGMDQDLDDSVDGVDDQRGSIGDGEVRSRPRTRAGGKGVENSAVVLLPAVSPYRSMASGRQKSDGRRDTNNGDGSPMETTGRTREGSGPGEDSGWTDSRMDEADAMEKGLDPGGVRAKREGSAEAGGDDSARTAEAPRRRRRRRGNGAGQSDDVENVRVGDGSVENEMRSVGSGGRREKLVRSLKLRRRGLRERAGVTSAAAGRWVGVEADGDQDRDRDAGRDRDRDREPKDRKEKKEKEKDKEKEENERKPLTQDEMVMLGGAFEFSKKIVSSVMTPLDRVFMLDSNRQLNFETLLLIFQSGHSRIPVFEGDRNHVIGILFAKDLILLDPEDAVPIKTVLLFFERRWMMVKHDVTLDEMLNIFKRGGGHLALVQSDREHNVQTGKGVIAGVVTLEDLIEELIGQDIVDETDVYTDNIHKRRVRRVRSVDPEILKMLDFKTQEDLLRLTGNEVRVVAAYLTTNFPAFAPEVIAPRVLLELLPEASVVEFPEPKSNGYGHPRVANDTGYGEGPDGMGVRLKHANESDPNLCGIDSTDGEDHNREDEVMGDLRRYIHQKNDKDDVMVRSTATIYRRDFTTQDSYLIINGKLEITAGNDGFVSEAGPWTLLGVRALTDDLYKPDFTARVSERPARLVQIRRRLYRRMVRYTSGDRSQDRRASIPRSLPLGSRNGGGDDGMQNEGVESHAHATVVDAVNVQANGARQDIGEKERSGALKEVAAPPAPPTSAPLQLVRQLQTVATDVAIPVMPVVPPGAVGGKVSQSQAAATVQLVKKISREVAYAELETGEVRRSP